MKPKNENIKGSKPTNSELAQDSKLGEQASAWDFKNEFIYNCDFSTEPEFPPATNRRHLNFNTLLREIYENDSLTI